MRGQSTGVQPTRGRPMSGRWSQKRLAILAALVLAGVFVAANVHLVTVAFTSQPACVAPTLDRPAAKPAC